jgi:PRTRC genetic system protein C
MSNSETRTYRYAGTPVTAPASLSPEEVRQAWSDVFPGLENAEIEEAEDGSVDFVVRAGTKG